MDSQEHRCRNYAETLGLEVENVFRDEGISGGLFDRPAMKALIKYLDNHWQNKYFVVFDDLKRFARDVEVHIRLRSELRCREAKLCCLNYNFDESAEGEFVETIFAAQNELERKQNRRQVCQKMKARLERGYWCLQAPVGYEYKKDKEHGKIIVPDPTITAILSEGLNAFAEERLASQVDVLKFFESKNFQEIIGVKKLKLDHIKTILTQFLYAGIIQYPKWGVSRRKGFQQSIISLQTYEKIQERLKRPERTSRETDSLEFPLRRLVNCSVCGKKMTGSVNRGKSKYYAHYTCNNKECNANPKNILASKLEEDYLKMLESIGVEREVLELGAALGTRIWQQKSVDLNLSLEKREAERKDLEKTLDNYVDLVATAKSESVRSRYEEKIEELDRQIKKLQSEFKNKKTPDVNAALNLMLRFLGTPAETWKNSSKQLKIVIHNMIFAENPKYCLNTGFGTPILSLPFHIKEYIDPENDDLVDLPRIELGT